MEEIIDFIDEYALPEEQREANTRIAELKYKLIQSDYKIMKHIEGQLPEEEYQSIKAERQEWRNEINRLEGQLRLV